MTAILSSTPGDRGSLSKEKRWQRALDADDLILQATAVVGRSEQTFPDIPRPFRGRLVVDGVEDLSRDEIELLEQLAKRSASLTLTVDENQRVRGRYQGDKVHGICPKKVSKKGLTGVGA